MIKEYGIKDWNSFIQTICEIANHQEYRMWYCGQADYEWGLIPSVQRPEYHKKGNEQYMATNFTIHDTQRRLDQILDKDPGCNYLYKIRIPAQIKREFVKELNVFGIHDSTVYPDMEHVAKEQRQLFEKLLKD